MGNSSEYKHDPVPLIDFFGPPFSSKNNPSIITPTTPSVTNTATSGYASMGCFNGPTGGPYGGHNLPKLLSNGSMCPELYIPSALAQVTAQTPVTYKYIGLEHGRECYAGSVPPNPEPSSLTGTHAYTTTCKGDSKQSCGGPIMYNLYEVFGYSCAGVRGCGEHG
ncbi:hypothetical protein QC760_004964 [Botrytis cinerea]